MLKASKRHGNSENIDRYRDLGYRSSMFESYQPVDVRLQMPNWAQYSSSSIIGHIEWELNKRSLDGYDFLVCVYGGDFRIIIWAA